MKVIAACGAGMGSSQMIKMKLQKVFKKLGIDAQITHTNVGEAKSMAKSYDIVFVSANFEKDFKNVGNAKVIGLKNLLSEQELEEKLRIALDLDPAQ